MKERKRNTKKKRKVDILTHIVVVTSVAIMILIADVFFVSIQNKHFASGTDLTVYSDTSNVVTETILSNRGTIYDRDGVVIAEDNHTYDIYCILDSSRPSADGIAYVKDKEGTAKILSEILYIDYDKVLDMLNQDVYQTELGKAGRNLSKDVKDEIESYKLPGVEFQDSVQRVYPMGTFASNLIGYVTLNEDGSYSGKMGLEQVLDSYLAGKNGSRTYQTDSSGYVLAGMKENVVSAKNGDDVTLTLDQELQETLEQSFKITQEQFNPDRIWGAVMEVDTGKVLAWGQSPSFDPNVLDISEYSNYGAQQPYEPGSTLKTFTWAATINEGKYDSDATAEGYQYCIIQDSNGVISRTYNTDPDENYGCITNYHHEAYSNPTLDDGLKYSLNTVAVTLENEYITPDILLDYMKKFGFFEDVDTDGLLETDGVLNFTWPMEKENLSFGQGSTVTMLQLLQAYSAIFSDGTMKKPYFIDSIRDSYDPSKILYQAEPVVTGTPVTAETAEKVRSILYKVVNEDGGTATRYKIPECSVIAKTGTTEVAINGTYDTDHVISSIMLGLPANDPKIMVYYAFEMDFQNIGTRTEAVTNILRKAAQIYNLSDNMTTTESTSQQTESTVDEIQTYSMPGVLNHSVEYAKSKLEALGTNVFVLGNGQNVIDQYPSESSTVETGQRVFLLTDTQSFTMPDLTGWTRKDVAGLWTTTGFGFELEGQGKVISQSVPAGTVVNKGTKIEVVFGE